MFSFLKKPKNGEVVKFKIGGMHCSSCAVDIDLTLEEIRGIAESKTNFARGMAEIRYDPLLIGVKEIVNEIGKTGYKIIEVI